MATIEHLAWDSDFFGFYVARLEHLADRPRLDEVLSALQFQGYRLCYLVCDLDDLRGNSFAIGAGARLMDQRCLYTRPIGGFEPGTASERQLEIIANEMPGLHSLALQSGEYSRFRLDPRMPAGIWANLYREWIEKSVSRTIADDVLIERARGSAVGLLTVKEEGQRGSIGLFAVDAECRGQGIGGRLLARGLEWFSLRGCTSCTVVTQGANDAARTIYRRSGFELESMRNIYHIWLEKG